MKQHASGGAAVLDAQGKVVATAGASRQDWDGVGLVRVPLPEGRALAFAPGEPSTDWPRFARAFVHEARSPLNALGIYLELLGSKTNDGKPGVSAERIMAKAQEQVRRVDELLRLFAELWAPRGDNAELATIARAAACFAEHEAIRLGLRFSQQICDAASVPVSPLRAADAIVGALSSALQARPESGIAFEVESQGGHVTIRVTIEPAGEPQGGLLDGGALAFREIGAEVVTTPSSMTATLRAGVRQDAKGMAAAAAAE